MHCGPSGFLSIGDDILHSNPLLQYIPDLTLLYVLQFWKPPSIATSCVCVCVQMGGCHSFALVGLERLFPFALCAAWFLGSGGVLTCIALHVDSCCVSGNAVLGVK